MTATLAEIRKRKRGIEVPVEICLDPAHAEDWNLAVSRYNSQLVVPTDLKAAEDRLEALRTEHGEMIVTFTFKNLTRDQYDQLKAENPDGTEFMQALIAESCVTPAVTLDEVQELWVSPEWANSELEALASGALQAQTVRPTIAGDPLKG